MSHRQKQRQVKRVQKKQTKKPKDKQPKQVYNSESEDDNVVEEAEMSEEEEVAPVLSNGKVKGFSDENKSWLKPKQQKPELVDRSSDDEEVESEIDEESEDEGQVKVGKLFDEEDEDDDTVPDDNFNDSDDEEEEDSSEEEDDEDEVIKLLILKMFHAGLLNE